MAAEACGQCEMQTICPVSIDLRTLVSVIGHRRMSVTNVRLFIVFSPLGFVCVGLCVSSRPDLIVGAPFFYGREAGGAIYVYTNPADGLTADTPYVRLLGKAESRLVSFIFIFYLLFVLRIL